mgnify:FL=1
MLTQKTCSEEKLHKLVNEAKTLEVATWLLKSRRSDLAGIARQLAIKIRSGSQISLAKEIQNLQTRNH